MILKITTFNNFFARGLPYYRYYGLLRFITEIPITAYYGLLRTVISPPPFLYPLKNFCPQGTGLVSVKKNYPQGTALISVKKPVPKDRPYIR